MPKKPASSKLAFPQECMVANFYDASADWPRLGFSEIARKMLGPKGFPKTKNARHFKMECRKGFNMGRSK
jgi:hypothetical protein